MARSTAWGSTASLSGAGAGARGGGVVPQPAITNAVAAATDRRAIISRTERQLRPTSRQRIAQDVRRRARARIRGERSEEHTSELQSRLHLVCRLLLEKKK